MNMFVEINAPRVCEITDASLLASGQGRIEVRLSGQLDSDKARLTIRGMPREGDGPSRITPTVSWRHDSDDWIAIGDADTGDHKEITCTLSYDEFSQHRRTITERISVCDILRLTIEQFGSADTLFAAVIDDPKLKNRDSGELEATVAALLAMAGFRVVTVDHIRDLGEVPDIVAVDKRDNILLVECTLKLGNADSKLDKLALRHRVVRELLDSKGLQEKKVIPLLAVAQPSDRVAPYFEDARKARVLLWDRDDLHRLRQMIDTHTAEEIVTEVSQQFEQMLIYESLDPYEDVGGEPFG